MICACGHADDEHEDGLDDYPCGVEGCQCLEFDLAYFVIEEEE